MITDLHWQKIGKVPHHGICVPLFSIHTKNSSGIGEFLDLIPLIDWCKRLKLDCIQLLPINDTGTDCSPYNPISSCALDPIYLSLHELSIPEKLNPAPRTELLERKLTLLYKHFLKTFTAISKTSPYQIFLKENPWLVTYARFKALKDPERDVDFYLFLQFHCYRQMRLVRNYADTQKIFIKGDIPILLNPDSADVWANPSLFRLDLSAGAPPDAYNQLGQNWGFPLFNWEAMRKDGYQWWQTRLKAIETLYHIYRIDHVVGFFRIWGIEKGEKATEGSFFPPDPNVWELQGQAILEMMIGATTLLPMAEDLGTIPKGVYPILKKLGICGTKVIRWERKEGLYIPFDQYEPLSMTTLSTPDIDTLELWWKKYPSEAIPFAQFMGISYHPTLSTQQRLKILRAAHQTPSLFHINLLAEYLALFPELVWPNAEDERINVAGTLLPSNWTYRLRPSLEELATHKGLIEAFSYLIE